MRDLSESTLFDFNIDDDCRLFLEIMLLHLLEINKVERMIHKNQKKFSATIFTSKSNKETGIVDFYSEFRKVVHEVE